MFKKSYTSLRYARSIAVKPRASPGSPHTRRWRNLRRLRASRFWMGWRVAKRLWRPWIAAWPTWKIVWRRYAGGRCLDDVLMMWCDVMWCDVMWCDMMRCNDMMGWDEMQWYGARCMHSCELMRVWCYEMLTWWQGFCLHIPGESQHTWYLGGSSHDGLARTSSTTLSGRMWTSALLGNRVQIAGQGETSDAECASDVSSLSVDEQATCTARRHAAVQQGHLQEMEQKVDKSQPQLVKIWSLQQTRRVSSCFSKMFTFLLGIPVSQPLL